MMELTPLLHNMVDRNASDLFITVGAPPILKIEGRTLTLNPESITPRQARELAYSVMDKEQIKQFENSCEFNRGLNMENIGRFRINVYRQRGEPAIVVRFLKGQIPSIRSLGLPSILEDLIMVDRGLVLVVGGTGTGKSTTLAAMIQHRAERREGHILTIEDPIEYLHHHQKSLVNQREVGIDTMSYENALKNALRESPDVIMIGEIRDHSTMKYALAYAETGHLCISTLHANSADQALERILNFFPETAGPQIRMDLSMHLRAIVSQRLAVGLDGKRIAVVETMLNTPHISDLIQKGRLEEIKDAISHSKGHNGNTFDDALFELNLAGKIAEQEALRLADSRNNLALRFRLEKGNVEVGTVKRDVVFDRKAPYNTYSTYRIIPVRVDTKRREDEEQVLTQAIKNYFEGQGYVEDVLKADIEIQYIFGLESKVGLSLEPIDEESDPKSKISTDSETHATMIVTIVDNVLHKPVWRQSASAKLKGRLRTQEEIDLDMAYVLENFPPLVKQAS